MVTQTQKRTTKGIEKFFAYHAQFKKVTKETKSVWETYMPNTHPMLKIYKG